MFCPTLRGSAWSPPSSRTGSGCGSSGRSRGSTWTSPGAADGKLEFNLMVNNTHQRVFAVLSNEENTSQFYFSSKSVWVYPISTNFAVF